MKFAGERVNCCILLELPAYFVVCLSWNTFKVERIAEKALSERLYRAATAFFSVTTSNNWTIAYVMPSQILFSSVNTYARYIYKGHNVLETLELAVLPIFDIQ